MSKETNVMTAVSSTVSFIKERIKYDLIDASDNKLINLKREEIEKLARVIELSIESNFTKSSQQIISACRE